MVVPPVAYPPEAVSWLAEHLRLAPGVAVAAVCGRWVKLPGALRPTGAQVIAIDPVCEHHAPPPAFPPPAVTPPAVAAMPAALPFRTSSLDAAALAHLPSWLDAEQVVGELGRVVRPGGRLGVIRHGFDWSTGWVSRVREVLDGPRHAVGRPRVRPVVSAIVGSKAFGTAVPASFHHSEACTPAEALERFRTTGQVNLLPPDQQGGLLDEVACVMATHPETRGRDVLHLRNRADVWVCEVARPL